VLFLGRPAAPYTTLRSAVQNRFLLIALVLVLVATAVGYALARGLTGSLLELARGADKIAKGDLTRSLDQLKALAEIGQTVSSMLNLETVLTAIVSHSVALPGSDDGAIYEDDESTGEFQASRRCLEPR
jgi:HAMP domain-containing protein